MAPAQHSTLKEGPYQAALAEIAAEQAQDYRQNTVPLIRRTIRAVQDQGSPQMLDRAASLAQGGALAEFEPQIAAGLRTQGSRLPMADTAMRTAAAKGTALAGFGARQGQKDAQLKGMETMLSVTRGQGGQALQGLSQVAGQAQDMGIRKAEADMTNALGAGQGIGTAAGMIGYGLMKR